MTFSVSQGAMGRPPGGFKAPKPPPTIAMSFSLLHTIVESPCTPEVMTPWQLLCIFGKMRTFLTSLGACLHNFSRTLVKFGTHDQNLLGNLNMTLILVFACLNFSRELF